MRLLFFNHSIHSAFVVPVAGVNLPNDTHGEVWYGFIRVDILCFLYCWFFVNTAESRASLLGCAGRGDHGGPERRAGAGLLRIHFAI